MDNKKRKILIIYATAGIGHKKASLAIKAAFDEIAPGNAEATLIDSLDYTTRFFKWVYLEFYLVMVNKLSSIWGFLYYLTDNKYADAFIMYLRWFNNWIYAKKLREYLIETDPDVIISTHFFASEVIADMKKNGKLASRLVTVVTDYRLHSWWVADHTDIYVVGSEDARQDLLQWSTPESKIKVLGIPVEPVFSRQADRLKTAQKLGLDKDKFTVLVVGGGFGVGPIEDIVKAMVCYPNIQIVVICGHNEKLIERVKKINVEAGGCVKPVGFVDNVYDFMTASDVLISKAGGITVSESLAKELPMIVIAPIPGQETRNSAFLMTHNAAVRVDTATEVRQAIEDLMAHPEKLERIKESIRSIRRPNASYDIAKLALELARE